MSSILVRVVVAVVEVSQSLHVVDTSRGAESGSQMSESNTSFAVSAQFQVRWSGQSRSQAVTAGSLNQVHYS